ncbi:MAG: hypothetical protein U0997_15620 [Sulfurimicrobium sp.]|nr:hypothetical protein [Sulfurimicrobium sp.]
MKLKKTLLASSIITTSLMAGAAFAGPDWDVIERARAVKQAEQTRLKDTAGGAQKTVALQKRPGHPQGKY